MKVIYSGLESSGKSLKLAMKAIDLVERNAKWFQRQQKDYVELGAEEFERKYSYAMPKARAIASNMPFSQKFLDFAQELGVPIQYWHHKYELIKLEDVDVICDEVANYWNSRMWQDMTTDELQWLSQGAKRGIEFYGASQDFAMVDKGFRRLCNELFYIKKLTGSPRPTPTRPPVKRIWGICLYWAMDPMSYDEETAKFQREQTIPGFFYIEKKYCELFDTNAKVIRSELLPKRHVVQKCELPNCEFHKVVHI